MKEHLFNLSDGDLHCRYCDTSINTKCKGDIELLKDLIDREIKRELIKFSQELQSHEIITFDTVDEALNKRGIK